MTQYIVEYDTGYGKYYEEVEAKDENEAIKMAYEMAKEEFESQADYGVVGVATDELREDYL